MPEVPIVPDHAQAEARAQSEASRLGRISAGFAVARLAWFVVIVLLAASCLTGFRAQGVLLLLASLAGFLVLALLHGRTEDRRSQRKAVAAYHHRGRDRLDGRHEHGQDDGNGYLQGSHAYARDLDLVGPGGLYARLNTGGSPAGRARLAALLLDDQPWEEQRARLVAALTPLHTWRAELAVAAELGQGEVAQAGWITSWLAHPVGPPGVGIRILVWLLRLLGLVAIGMSTPWSWPVGFLVAVLLVGLAWFPLDLWAVRRLDLPGPAARMATVVRSQARTLNLVASLPVQEPSLQQMVAQAQTGAAALHRLAAQLDRLANRANPLAAHFSAVVLAAWGSLGRLAAWSREHGAAYPGWIAIQAEIEALACLATHAAEQGGCPAEVSAVGPAFAAEDLQHPLLRREARVGNDLLLTDGQVLLLTGANASGKSTFLRAIGLAVLMARLGLPVAARSCRLRPLRLATVMRVHDDLRHGLSRFQAEVAALRRTLDRIGEQTPIPALVALDEILAGTNSRERHLGTRAILGHLRGRGGLVLVTTHDLELAAIAAEEPSRFVLAHFADRAVLGEAGHADDVVFDYKLRPGVLASTNALRVMRAAGLPMPEDWLHRP